jgi:hypothetical protein
MRRDNVKLLVKGYEVSAKQEEIRFWDIEQWGNYNQ